MESNETERERERERRGEERRGEERRREEERREGEREAGGGHINLTNCQNDSATYGKMSYQLNLFK